jgi:hypothetical protein
VCVCVGGGGRWGVNVESGKFGSLAELMLHHI